MTGYRYRELINEPQRRRETLEYRLLVAACVPCVFIWLATFLVLSPLIAAGLLIAPAFWSREVE